MVPSSARSPLLALLVLAAACGEPGGAVAPDPAAAFDAGTQAPPPEPGVPPVIDAMGLPDCFGTLLTKAHYTICHDDDWLIPEWVGYPLVAADLDGPAERTDDFRADPGLASGRRAENSDYEGSGYDRGHLAPAEDFDRSFSAMSQTFFLSNIAPQLAGLNRGPWKSLESFTRQLAAEHGLVQVLSGNLFLDAQGQVTQPIKRIGSSRVAVPTHSWKALLTVQDGQGVGYAFLLPNVSNPPPWRASGIPIDQLESLTGFDFFADLEDALEARLEAETPALP